MRDLTPSPVLMSVRASSFFSNHQCLEDCEKQHLFDVVLPAMVDLALSAPILCTMASTIYQFLWDLFICGGEALHNTGPWVTAVR